MLMFLVLTLAVLRTFAAPSSHWQVNTNWRGYSRAQAAPVFAEDWVGDECSKAPSVSKLQKACTNQQIQDNDKSYWDDFIQPELDRRGISPDKICTTYTITELTCENFCALKGTNCIAATETLGFGTKKKPLIQCKRAPTLKSGGGCNPSKKVKRNKLLCTCGPFEPNCWAAQPPGEACASNGDPHITPFLQFTGMNPNVPYGVPKLDYMQIGEHRYVRSLFNGKVDLEVIGRLTAHPVITGVATNKAIAIRGEQTCGHVLEVVASHREHKYNRQLLKGRGGDPESIVFEKELKPKFIVDGTVYDDGASFIEAVKSLNCAKICNYKNWNSGNVHLRRVMIQFQEGTKIHIGHMFTPRFGMSLRVFLSAHMFAATSSAVIYSKESGIPESLHKNGGLCMASTDQHVPCDESFFSDESYHPDESCDDHQPDPNRPEFLPDPIEKCKNELKSFYKEVEKYCKKHCKSATVAETCIYDACLVEDLSGAQEVADECDFEEEANDDEKALPTPRPTFPCKPLLGIKFKWNKDKKADEGARPKADMMFKRDIWDKVYEHNHGPRHLQKKFYTERIKGMTDYEIACLCFEYCSKVQSHWFQCNLKRRKKTGNRYGKCQCYNGEPVFKKSRPTYSTGALSKWATRWLAGAGVKSRANDLTGVGVTFDVPETRKKVESEANPHVFSHPEGNDMKKAGLDTKAGRKSPKGKVELAKRWKKKFYTSGAHSYRNFGTPPKDYKDA